MVVKDSDRTQFLVVLFFRRKTCFLPLHPSSHAYYCEHAKLGLSELGLLLVTLFNNNNGNVVVIKATVCLNTA